jgi:hypothetical protein
MSLYKTITGRKVSESLRDLRLDIQVWKESRADENLRTFDELAVPLPYANISVAGLEEIKKSLKSDGFEARFVSMVLDHSNRPTVSVLIRSLKTK